MAKRFFVGRVSKPPSDIVKHALSSLRDDLRLFEYDIDGTEAHNIMLAEQGINTVRDCATILYWLEQARNLFREGRFPLDESLEDVHTAIEHFVVSKAGIGYGGRLHAGRSRNDQVAVDIRMYVRDEIIEVSRTLLELVESLSGRSKEFVYAVMPGYTHLQHAQVTTFAHFLTSYCYPLLRNVERLLEAFRRVNRCPLGASALAGTSLPLNRERVAELLGFDGIITHSVDASSSRDFMCEVASILSLIALDLSKMSEDLVTWSTHEFGFVELADELCSTSSVMPQKRNPDALELVRAMCAEVVSSAYSLHLMLSKLPSGYMRDLQLTKPPLWRAIDSVKQVLQVMKEAVETLTVNVDRMREASLANYANAVDLAEALVMECGLGFREAHAAVGKLVKQLSTEGRAIHQLSSEELSGRLSEILGKKIRVGSDLAQLLSNPLKLVERRRVLGGPSPQSVERMLEEISSQKTTLLQEIEKREKRIGQAKQALQRIVREYLERYAVGEGS